MNILIKLTCLIGLVIAPILGGHNAHTAGGCDHDTAKCCSVDGKCDKTNCDHKTCDKSKCTHAEKKTCNHHGEEVEVVEQEVKKFKFIGADSLAVEIESINGEVNFTSGSAEDLTEEMKTALAEEGITFE